MPSHWNHPGLYVLSWELLTRQMSTAGDKSRLEASKPANLKSLVELGDQVRHSTMVPVDEKGSAQHYQFLNHKVENGRIRLNSFSKVVKDGAGANANYGL